MSFFTLCYQNQTKTFLPFLQFLEYCLPMFIYLLFNLKHVINLSLYNFICTVTIPMVLEDMGFWTHIYTPKYSVTTFNIYVFLIQ